MFIWNKWQIVLFFIFGYVKMFLIMLKMNSNMWHFINQLNPVKYNMIIQTYEKQP